MKLHARPFAAFFRLVPAAVAFLVSGVRAAPTISSVATNPASPGNYDNVAVTALVQPSSGASLSQVQLQYSTGAVTTSTVFLETMTVTANNGWNGTGAQNPWTVTALRAGGDVRQRSGTANHTPPVLLTNCTISGTTTVTCDSTAAIWPGMSISGVNIAAGTAIAAVTSATAFTLSAAATGSGTAQTLTAAGATLTNCATTAASATVTCDSTAGLVVGMGLNVPTAPANPTVLSITNATTFVLSSNATTTATGQTFTASGCGVEMSVGTATYTDTMITTGTSINAGAASSGYVEFYVRTSGLVSNNGWTLQVSPDGGTTWNTRLSESYSSGPLASCTLNSANSGTGSTTILCSSTTGLATGMNVQGAGLLIASCITSSTTNPTVVLTSNTAGLAVGMFVTGTAGQGIPNGARITAISPGTSFTLSAAATVTNASPGITLTASYLQGNTTITGITPNVSFTVNNAAFYSGTVSLVNHSFMLKHYDFAAGELTSSLRMRFQYSGYTNTNPAPAPVCDVDDIVVSLTTGNPPVVLTMINDGTYGNGVYGAVIPVQPGGTTVSYTVTASDSASGTAASSGSYTVATVSPVLTVTPASAATFVGVVGGLFTPSSVSYTLANTGTGSLKWTAGNTAAWLTVAPASGTLAAGASTTVTASINSAASSLAVGSYSDVITFANTTNGSGSTTSGVSLTAVTVPAVPVPAALPAYSRGSSSTLSWAAVPSASSYTVQVALSADFSNVLSSQTVAGTSASFINLTNGVTYYYRVLATNIAGSSVYSTVVSSIQDTTSPVVAISSPATGTSTATASITVSGTSSDSGSGLAVVKVNNYPVTTTNGYVTWSVTVPLGFGTNALTATATDNAGNFTTTSPPVLVTVTTAQTYNPLYIPEAMTGTTFNLTLDAGAKQFFSGVITQTYGYNHGLFWGPTLIMKKGDFVQINLTNNLAATTTTHWHGFHIPAIMDGGPHETIPAGTTWSPSFYIKNQAATFWYHPHLHPTTQAQLTMGAGGLIIVQDDQEAALTLPRTYGVDDFPIVLTSRSFQGAGATANQFALNGAFGDYMLVNGTMNPQVSLPAQIVRLRILDAEIARWHNLGFSDGRTFYVIGTDGGLLNAPVPVTQMVIGPSERYEILLDLRGVTPGTTLDLTTYNSGQPTGYSGGQAGTTGANGSLLNNTTFVDLHINVVAATANAVTTIPTTLASNVYWTSANVTNNRSVSITGVGGNPLSFDNLVYSSSVINQTINLNAVEQWTLTNASNLAHTFHIHDIQFYLTSNTGAGGLPAYMQGWKDSLNIYQQSSVTFITKFSDFASNTNPFMYHCHFLQHEDGGLMGQFLVQNNQVENLTVASFTRTGNNPAVHMEFTATAGTTYTVQYSPDMTSGSWTDVGSITSNGFSADFYETDPGRLSSARGFYRVTMPIISQ